MKFSGFPAGWRARHRALADFIGIASVGLIVGLLLWVLRGGRHFWGGMLYSMAISLAIGYGIALYNAAVCRLLRRLRGSTPQLEQGWPGWPLALPGVLLMPPLGYTLGHATVDLLLGRVPFFLWNASLTQALVSVAVTVFISVLASWYFFTRESLAALRLAHEQGQRQLAEAQLLTLQTQLEPHMLFNTLAHLRVLIGLRPAEAQVMLDELIAYLRATLQASRATLHPLASEFERLRDYLRLMQRRMGERLQVDCELPDALAEVPVPPLLLQPLVENAIKHGLEPALAGGRLRIRAARDAAGLCLTVEDDGVGLSAAPAPGGTQFGLQQVRDRLRTQYGGRAHFDLEALQPHGCRATLRLPP